MSKFNRLEFYKNNKPYELLPFKFDRLNSDKYILTNMVGEFLLVAPKELGQLTKKQLPADSELFSTLRSKHYKYGLNISIYNHQLCVVNPDIWEYCRQSISDWKNEYADECQSCNKRNECGGFFFSGIQYKYSDHLKPL